MTRTNPRLARVAALLAFAVAGCGGGNTANVSGVVTLDGKPLDGAAVTFTPTTGGDIGGSTARTDAQGRYTLRTVSGDKPGAALGNHRVAVSLSKENPKNQDLAVTDVVPARYNQKTELKFDVPAGGTDAANFDLKGK